MVSWGKIDFLIHKDLLNDMISCEEFKEKMLLLSRQIIYGLDKKTLRLMFKKLGLVEYTNLLNGMSQKVEKTNVNEMMLEGLKLSGWISDYKEDKTDEGYYQVFAKEAGKIIINKPSALKSELRAAAIPEDE